MDWKDSLVDQRTRHRNQPRLLLKWRCSCQHQWSGHRENSRTRDCSLHHDPEDEDSRQLRRVRHKGPYRGIFDLELSPLGLKHTVYTNYFAKWEEEGVVDLKYEFKELLMLISGRCLVGKEVREKMFGQFCTLYHQIEEGLNFASFMFPYIPIPVNRRRDRARIKLRGILSEVVRSRKSLNHVEEDVLQRFIDATYKDGRGTTVEEVSALIITLIFAGKHSSAMTSTWTAACLLDHAKSLDAALEEQRQIIGKYKDKIDYNILSEMGVLHSCIKEAARMHPAPPALVRQVKKDVTVRTKEGNEYGISTGHTLVHLVMLNGLLPQIYKDPEVYDPDRFRPIREEDKAAGKFSYTSFGAGRHACGGEAYAYMQIKIIFSHLLRNFELKLVSSFPKPDWTQFLPEPTGEVMVSYKRRRLPSD